MDPEIEELKELVRQNTAISQETNKVVHSMRNAARWGRFIKLVWLGILIAAALGMYVYFAPYLNQIVDLYGKVLSASNQVQEYGGQISDFINNANTSTPVE